MANPQIAAQICIGLGVGYGLTGTVRGTAIIFAVEVAAWFLAIYLQWLARSPNRE